MANAEGRKAITQLYESFWKGSTPPAKAIAFSLELLSEGYQKVLTPMTYRLYTAVLVDLTPDEIVLAFSRAAQECQGWFPPPATLRAFSGQPMLGDPIATEAKSALMDLITGMRSAHGPKLEPLPGPVLYGTEDDPKDADGVRTHAPIRGEGTPFPIARRTAAALLRLGWGDRQAGIAVIADHPSLRRTPDFQVDDQYRTNLIRASDEILRRFTEAYREV